MAPTFHHVAVETPDLAGATGWYQAFFDAKLNWTLERFSPLTHSRLPGIRRQVEIQIGAMRIHLFERTGVTGAQPVRDVPALQHLCMQVASMADLEAYRARWMELHRSGRFAFAKQEPATDLVVDDDGVASFYFLDPSGIEFEMTYVPEGVAR